MARPIMRTIIAAALTVATLGTTLAISTSEADAQYRRRGYGGAGVAAGIIGGVAAGALIAGATRPAYGAPAYAYEDPGYDDGPVCHLERQRVYLDDGRYTYRRVRVCD